MESYIKENKYFYLGLIFAIWLFVYIVSQFIFDQNLGWDETTYLAIAKGIAEDFDFSSRQYTIMGLLKHGYPTHFINLPVYSIRCQENSFSKKSSMQSGI